MKQIKLSVQLFFILSSIIFFSYCKNGGAGVVDTSLNPIVTVNNNTLYQGDLEQILPKGLSSEDSARFAESYVNTWINNELLYNKAEKNIIDEETIDELVENYRKSLIVNSYQQYLLKDELSKEISEGELQAYYESHKDELRLKENIIKGLYLKIPVESPQLENFKKWYKQTSDAAIENIEKNSLQNVVGYEYFYDKWIDLNDVMVNIPYSMTDVQSFLKNNKSIEVQDSSFVYLLNIKEYKTVGTTAPFDYIKDRMINVYLENKKSDFLEKIQKDLYDKALSNDEIKFYKE